LQQQQQQQQLQLQQFATSSNSSSSDQSSDSDCDFGDSAVNRRRQRRREGRYLYTLAVNKDYWGYRNNTDNLTIKQLYAAFLCPRVASCSLAYFYGFSCYDR